MWQNRKHNKEGKYDKKEIKKDLKVASKMATR